MHKVKISAIKTLESSKYNEATGQNENPCKGIVRWDTSVPLTEAGTYNNQDCWLLTNAEYEQLRDGKDWAIPESTRQALKTVATMLLDLTNN